MCKTDHIRIITGQIRHAMPMAYFNDINRTDGTSFLADFIQKGNHFFLIRYSDIKAAQIRVFSDNVLKKRDGGDFKVDINGVDIFICEFLIEEIL